MDPYLRILIYFIYATSSIILLFLVAITFLRLKSAREERKYRLCEKEWEALYIDYMIGKMELNDVKKQFLKKRRYKFYKHFFAPYLEMLDGKDFEATKALCREISLIGHYRKKLLSRKLYDKATAAKLLGTFRCYQSVPERVRMLKSKSELLVLAAAQGLAVSGDSRTFKPVLKALLSNTSITFEGITEILSRYGRDICQPITKLLDEYSRGGLPAELKTQEKSKAFVRSLLPKSDSANIDRTVLIVILIDLLGHYRYEAALPVLNRLFERVDTETSVHILKAFLRIGSLPEEYDPKFYLNHEDWVIRNFAVQVTELAQDESIIPLLDQLLDDEQWWVRYHAARVILTLGDAGYRQLTLRADDSKTRAATIAAYMLASKEVS
jgi:hypothetical protein